MSHDNNRDRGRPQHNQRHRHHDSKPYDRQSGGRDNDRQSGGRDNDRHSGGRDNNRRGGGYHDNRRDGNHDNRRGGGGYRRGGRGGYHDNTPISPEVEVEVKLLFNKSYVFEGDYSLPDPNTWFSHEPFKVGCILFIWLSFAFS